jgi:hypothetical protein
MHGRGGSAGGIHGDRVQYWLNNSYTDVETYGTTYNTGATDPNLTMKCEWVIQVCSALQNILSKGSKIALVMSLFNEVILDKALDTSRKSIHPVHSQFGNLLIRRGSVEKGWFYMECK